MTIVTEDEGISEEWSKEEIKKRKEDVGNDVNRSGNVRERARVSEGKAGHVPVDMTGDTSTRG